MLTSTRLEVNWPIPSIPALGRLRFLCFHVNRSLRAWVARSRGQTMPQIIPDEMPELTLAGRSSVGGSWKVFHKGLRAGSRLQWPVSETFWFRVINLILHSFTKHCHSRFVVLVCSPLLTCYTKIWTSEHLGFFQSWEMLIEESLNKGLLNKWSHTNSRE